MPISSYLKSVREKVGHDLLTMTAVAIAVFDAEGRLLEVQDSVAAADRHQFRYEVEMR